MLIHSSQKKVDGNMELFVDGLPIEQVQVMTFLGVLNYTLTCWGAHIAHICAKVSHSLNLLWHISWFLPKFLLCPTSSPSYVIPTSDYCDVGWSNCIPLLTLSVWILLSIMVVVLFFTILAFTLPLLPDRSFHLLP